MALRRLRTKGFRARPIDPSEGQKARSVYHHRGRAAGAAVLLLRPFTLFSYLSADDLRPRSSSPWCYGAGLQGVGPAIMTMHPVNGGVGFPGMAAMGGVPDITATEGDDGGSSVLSEADGRRTGRWCRNQVK